MNQESAKFGDTDAGRFLAVGSIQMVSNIRNRIIATGTSLAALAATAPAFADDPFTAAMTSATTSVGTYAAALVTLSAVAVVFMIGMKYVKKIVKAS